MKRVRRYLWNLLISVDQLINTLFGGDPDETVSSRLGKQTEHCRLCRWFCKLLSKLDPDHCQKSIEPDRGTPWKENPMP